MEHPICPCDDTAFHRVSCPLNPDNIRITSIENGNFDLFHVITKKTMSDGKSTQKDIMNHFVIAALNPSHAMQLLEENGGWNGNCQYTIKKADYITPVTISTSFICQI